MAKDDDKKKKIVWDACDWAWHISMWIFAIVGIAFVCWAFSLCMQ